MNKMVKWLQQTQTYIQHQFKARVPKQKVRAWDNRGIFLAVRCTCGHDFNTPYNIPSNGKCPECKRLFCRGDNRTTAKTEAR